MKRPRLLIRRVLVDSMQHRLIAASALHFVLLMAVLASALLIPLMARLSVEAEYDPGVIQAAHQFLDLHYRVWPPLFLTLALLTLHNIMVTHRIAGPLYRIRRELAAIGNGDLSRTFRIRPSDYLAKDADAINSMVGSLKERVERIDVGHEAANAALTRLETAARSNSKERIEAALNDLRASLSTASVALDEFETGREPRLTPAVHDPEFEVVS